MTQNTETLYQERLQRYTTAMRNEKPDCVPVRPFAAEFCGKYAGFTCQQVTHNADIGFQVVFYKTTLNFNYHESTRLV